jgi:ABC-type glycerol-3-phosphate transport system permease component
MGWLFVDKAQNVTLAMAISGMIQGDALQSWSNLSALAILMTLPVILVFYLLQRTMIDRLLISAVDN